MSKKLLVLYFSVLLFSVVVGTQIVKVAEANFVPLPSTPEPPTISIQSPTSGGMYFQDYVSLTFTVEKPYPAGGEIQYIAYSLDGEEMGYIDGYYVTIKELSEGLHTVEVSVYLETLYNPGPGMNNRRGFSKGFASVTFLVDAVPPEISVLSPQNKTYPITDVPLNFNLSELAKWIGYSLDGQTNVTITGNTTLPELSDGSHSLTVYANDTVGRFGTSETIYFAVDTVLPKISFISPKNKTYYKANITLSFTVDESVSWIAYILDGQENVTINGNVTLTELSDGSHSLTIYARDLSGNTGASETIYFNIKTQPLEPFPTWIVAVIVIVAVVLTSLLFYFVKVRKTTGEGEKMKPEGVM